MKARFYKVRQDLLTSECWLIQIMGLEACATCEYRGKRECGGKKARREMTAGKRAQVGILEQEVDR